MGCQSSQQANHSGPEIKISILDYSFMKAQYVSIRKQMQDNNITFQCYISLDCFFDDFVQRYYNRIVTSVENYKQLKKKLQKIAMTPYIYVILDGKTLPQQGSFNTIPVENYGKLVDCLKQSTKPNLTASHIIPINSVKKKVDVKILCKPANGVKNSEQTIFENALTKAQIQYQFYTSFQMLQQSLYGTQAKFIVTDYIFHKQVIQLLKKCKTKIICYCAFEESQSYSADLYFVSNNYLDITNSIKSQLGYQQKSSVKCSKIYLYQVGLQDCQEISEVIEQFGIQVRIFNNMEKVIHDTTYFFCVTVVTAESQAKNVIKFLQKNNYQEKVKILTVGKNTQPTIKGLFKLIRDIKKGYYLKKCITNSIDIIDKHYNSTKFQQIKKQLQTNDIKFYGYNNINQFITQKKFISPFIICNFEQKQMLTKYLNHLQSKTRIIIFCNKNKITPEIKVNPAFAYVSSHFGKIIKFIQKTHVFLPILDQQDQIMFKQKISKIKIINRRISALKWSNMVDQNGPQSQQKFQFLNIAKGTNNEAIRDIQKSVATIWKVQISIFQLQNFKQQFIHALKQLNKIHKLNCNETQLTKLTTKIKQATFYQLLQKVKTFFDADNQLGLEINKSLMATQSLEKKEIVNMRQFLLLVFINYYSAYQIPRINKKKMTHWISNPLIQKCQVDSYLFCKHFIIFYDESLAAMQSISKYKLELQLEFNTVAQPNLLYNSFIRYKDKTIFCPFSQFQVTKIENAGQFKIVTVKYIKNVDFLKSVYQLNLLKEGNNLSSLGQTILKPQCQLIDQTIRQNFINNLQRIKSIQLFQRGQTYSSIQMHQKLIKENEQKQNLDSVLINELNYQICCFYLKANRNRQAAAVIKELLEANPGEYIKQQCQNIIKEVIDPETKSGTQKTIEKRRISEQAIKTFIWLKNKQSQQDKSINSQQDQLQENFQECVFAQDMRCMEIDDLQQMKGGLVLEEAYKGKQNIL